MSTKVKEAKKELEKMLGAFSFATFMLGARTTLDLSQVEMAKKLKISRSALCEIEKGRTLVSPETAVRYARRIGFSETAALEGCFQDSLKKIKIKKRVKIIDISSAA